MKRMKSAFLLPVVIIGFHSKAICQTLNERNFAATAESFAFGKWPDKADISRLNTMYPGAAVKHIAFKAKIISQTQFNTLKEDKLVTPQDEVVGDLGNLPPGFMIGFIAKGKVVHVMISMGDGMAAGTDNLKAIGLGNNDKWEMVSLKRMPANRVYYEYAVAKSVDQIMLASSVAVQQTDTRMNNSSTRTNGQASGQNSNGSNASNQYGAPPNVLASQTTQGSKSPTYSAPPNAPTNNNPVYGAPPNAQSSNAPVYSAPPNAQSKNAPVYSAPPNSQNNNGSTYGAPPGVLAGQNQQGAGGTKASQPKTGTNLSGLTPEQRIAYSDSVNKAYVSGERSVARGNLPLPELTGDKKQNAGSTQNAQGSQNPNYGAPPAVLAGQTNQSGQNQAYGPPPGAITGQQSNGQNKTQNLNYGAPPAVLAGQTNQSGQNPTYGPPPGAITGQQSNGQNKASNSNAASNQYGELTLSPPPTGSKSQQSNGQNKTQNPNYGAPPAVLEAQSKQAGQNPAYGPPPGAITGQQSNGQNKTQNPNYGAPPAVLAGQTNQSGQNPTYGPPPGAITGQQSNGQNKATNSNAASNQYGELTLSPKQGSNSGYGAPPVSDPRLNFANLGTLTVKDWAPDGSITPIANANAQFRQYQLTEKDKIKYINQYVIVAYNFFNEHPNALTATLSNGDIVLYDEAFNLFALYAPDGKPKQMICPKEKKAYFDQVIKQ